MKFLERLIDKLRFWEPGTMRFAWESVPEDWRELPDHEKFELIKKFGCLVCDDNSDFSIYKGPSGGMSQNVWCSSCGTRWNVAVMPGPDGQQAGIAELVTEREREEEFKKQKEHEEEP